MDKKNKNGHHKIAIVGTSSLFPGALDSKDFWLNILAEKDFIRDVPETHWLKEDYYDPKDKSGDKVYCQKGSFLDDVDFDPVEFGMPPNLLKTTDTVQLLSLVVARDTLADTVSYREGKVDTSKVSVILGVAGGTELFVEMASRVHKPEWVNAMRAQGLPESKIDAVKAELNKNYTVWNENTFPGLLGNVVSGRIANRFNFNGTNCVLDAACASSLAAIKMGIQELQLGSTDMVITGGSDALNDISMYMCFSRTTALSPSEDCKPFSDKGDGTVLGEGVAMMTMKRLEDAERDGDKIYAVISSIGSSSDGRSGSIYAPDSKGQSLAIQRAYEDAGFSSSDVELVEAHGTGTMAGDYAEFNGLRLGFGETDKMQYCALGSVKSMIGHTKSCAGAASLVKVIMALNNKVFPPTIKIDQPNPKIDIKNSPFYLNTKPRPWIHRQGETRKAGVSSMGFGGTNFHIAVESYLNKSKTPPRIYNPSKELLLFSGKTRSEIIDKIDKVKQSSNDLSIVSIAKETQAQFSTSETCRLAVLGETRDELFKWIDFTLKELGKDKSSFEIHNSVYYSDSEKEGKVAFIFTGQGSQYVNMGKELVMQYDEALEPWDITASIKMDAEKELSDVVFPIPVFSDEERIDQSNLLRETKWAQPSIGTLALSHLNLLRKLDVAPELLGGHSYGEVVALYAAGIIKSQEELIQISRKRGELMAIAGEKFEGAMSAVFASDKDVEAILKKNKLKAVIANINSPTQTVISGTSENVQKTELAIEHAGFKYQRLNVSTAFHSEVVAESSVEFDKYLNTIKFSKGKIPVYSNTTAKKYPIKNVNIAEILAKQISAPVSFVDQINTMYDHGARTFVELGPNNVLGKFVKEILKDKPHNAISLDGGYKMNSKDAFWSAVGQLAVSGVPISFDKIWEHQDLNIKAIPEKKASIVSVKINGSNFGKPYPPVGGFKNLAKKNPEPSIQPNIPSNLLAPQPQTNSFKAQSTPVIKNEKPIIPIQNSNLQSTKRASENGSKNQNNHMTKINTEWFKTFQEIQNNMLEAQKSIQHTLAESHRIFLETSQIAFQHLGNLSNHSSQGASVQQFVQATPEQQIAKVQTPVNIPVAVPAQAPVLAAIPNTPVQISSPATLINTAPAPVVQQAPVAVVSAASNEDFEDVMLTIVAEKTGYPKEILDLKIDLESGLGIDSIKRVEILSALQEKYPALKQVDTAKLAAMNTLGEILAFSNEAKPESLVSPAANTSMTESTVPEAPAFSGEDFSAFEDTMLSIVAEKTGYPKEILDLKIDLESGLGIDSIKRVEILSALQEKYPSLKQVDTAKLAAMNTLGEILDFAVESQANGLNPDDSDVKKKSSPPLALESLDM